MKYSVIKCKSIYDSGVVIKTYKGLFSWFKAINHVEKLSVTNCRCIYGIKKALTSR